MGSGNRFRDTGLCKTEMESHTATIMACVKFISIALCIPALSNAKTLNCHGMEEAECVGTNKCAWNPICQQCRYEECEMHFDKSECITGKCRWSNAYRFCYKDSLPCYVRASKETCMDADAPDCAWYSVDGLCITSTDLCSSYFNAPSCVKGDLCIWVDGTCHAKNLPPVCESIKSQSACLNQPHCQFESFYRFCYKKSSTKMCYLIGQDEDVCSLYSKCLFHKREGCLPREMCDEQERMEVFLTYVMADNPAYDEHLATGIIPPPEPHGPTASIIGSGVTRTKEGLLFDAACIHFPPFYGGTLSSGLTLYAEIKLGTLEIPRIQFMFDLSSNKNTLMLSIGPGNNMQLFARRTGRFKSTVFKLGIGVLKPSMSLVLAVDKHNVMVFVNTKLVMKVSWMAGMLEFSGETWIGCSATRDNHWQGTLSALALSSVASVICVATGVWYWVRRRQLERDKKFSEAEFKALLAMAIDH